MRWADEMEGTRGGEDDVWLAEESVLLMEVIVNETLICGHSL